ncbi:MAG TPA: penicillin acylase family protein, partial [Spirochaetota bacterium]|nr:penicillin acylase family protein [Spirochaetota bacterium]
MRRIVYVIVIAAVLAAAAYIALFVVYPRFEVDPLSYDDTLKAGVKMPVRIVRDVNGIPSILAENTDDLYFAMGYVHAQDRVNVMEYYRAIVSGYSNVVIDGDDGKMLRRLVSILSIEDKADDLVSGLTTGARTSLDSYVNGINTWTARRGHMKGLSRIPVNRPWKAADVVAIHLLREWADSYL